MTVTLTEDAGTLCSAALRQSGVVALDTSATTEETAVAIASLNRMLKGWQNDGPNIWTYTEQEVTLTTAASYTMSPVRPLSIHGVRYDNGTTETPMQELTRQEYDDLPLKTVTGTPTCYYYDRQREAAKIYIWPVLASASGQTLNVTFVREFEDITDAADVVDVPAEWYDCVVYNLADRLADDLGVKGEIAARVRVRAAHLYDQALSFDREGTFSFMDIR